MSTVAIIPARSESKGLPGKNIRDLAGKPLMGWTIEAALAAKHVDRVIVSTDSEEYANVARACGAEVPFLRPADIADDTASSESALLHALQWLKANENYEPETLVFLQCTSPLTIAEDIDGTVAKIKEAGADSALSVNSSHVFLWKEDTEGSADGLNHDKRVRLRRQDMEPEYAENGAVYVMKTAGFLEHKHRFFGKTALHCMPPERPRIELDDDADWVACTNFLEKRALRAGA